MPAAATPSATPTAWPSSPPTTAKIPCRTANGDTITALPWKTVRNILDRFRPLNPYDPDLLQPWKVEHESLDHQLYCYAISAKRYALYRHDSDGKRQLVAAHDHDDAPDNETTSAEDPLTDWSEHGLGMYLDPTIEVPDKPQRDEKGRRLWIAETWHWVLSGLQDPVSPMPSWADRYALSQFTVSSPALANWFKGFNAHQPPEERIRPGSFGLIAHPDPAFSTSDPEPVAARNPSALPTAPYERKPERWPELAWYDRATGKPLSVFTAQARDQPERFAHALTAGAVIIDTLANVLSRYTHRPEHKSRAPNGQAAGNTTIGQLLRRPVRAAPATTLLTGKEGNRLIERLTDQITDAGEYRNDYGARGDPWDELILPVLRDMGAASIIAHGVPPATAYRALTGQRPRRANRDQLQAAGLAFATAHLTVWGVAVPADANGGLAAYDRECRHRGQSTRRCLWCGEPLPSGSRSDAVYHNDACRQAAKRARKSA